MSESTALLEPPVVATVALEEEADRWRITVPGYPPPYFHSRTGAVQAAGRVSDLLQQPIEVWEMHIWNTTVYPAPICGSRLMK